MAYNKRLILKKKYISELRTFKFSYNQYHISKSRSVHLSIFFLRSGVCFPLASSWREDTSSIGLPYQLSCFYSILHFYNVHTCMSFFWVPKVARLWSLSRTIPGYHLTQCEKVACLYLHIDERMKVFINTLID